eukprot:4225693-Karenia_brevis.AAC.1
MPANYTKLPRQRSERDLVGGQTCGVAGPAKQPEQRTNDSKRLATKPTGDQHAGVAGLVRQQRSACRPGE